MNHEHKIFKVMLVATQPYIGNFKGGQGHWPPCSKISCENLNETLRVLYIGSVKSSVFSSSTIVCF